MPQRNYNKTLQRMSNLPPNNTNQDYKRIWEAKQILKFVSNVNYANSSPQYSRFRQYI